MGRILAIDYGRKRVGVAVTDPLNIIASPLITVPAREIEKFLEEIELTRRTGYGVDREEYLKGLRAIAGLIYAGSTPVGAVWIVGFSHSMKDEKLSRMIQHLKETTALISERLTHLRASA